MKTKKPKEATDRKENETVEPSRPTEDETDAGEVAAKTPRLASIVREVEAAVRDLEEPPAKE